MDCQTSCSSATISPAIGPLPKKMNSLYRDRESLERRDRSKRPLSGSRRLGKTDSTSYKRAVILSRVCGTVPCSCSGLREDAHDRVSTAGLCYRTHKSNCGQQRHASHQSELWPLGHNSDLTVVCTPQKRSAEIVGRAGPTGVSCSRSGCALDSLKGMSRREPLRRPPSLPVDAIEGAGIGTFLVDWAPTTTPFSPAISTTAIATMPRRPNSNLHRNPPPHASIRRKIPPEVTRRWRSDTGSELGERY
jgi:hypothetical protein